MSYKKINYIVVPFMYVTRATAIFFDRCTYVYTCDDDEDDDDEIVNQKHNDERWMCQEYEEWEASISFSSLSPSSSSSSSTSFYNLHGNSRKSRSIFTRGNLVHITWKLSHLPWTNTTVCDSLKSFSSRCRNLKV